MYNAVMAMDDWQKILVIVPNNKVILTREGDSYRTMGQYDEAEQFYKAALNIEFDVYAILGLALINKKRGNYEEAIESLFGLMKNDAKNHRLYTEIADCYMSLNQKDKAMEVLMQYQKMGMRNIYVNELIDKIRQSL